MSTESVVTTVVIPAHNAAATIGQQLEALGRQDYDQLWEVVVVDDASSDDTVTTARRYADQLPRLQVVRLDRHAGANTARNAGAERALGTYLVFCDADDEADPHWLSALAGGLALADAVGGRVDLDRLNAPRIAERRRPFSYESDLVLTPGLPMSPIGTCCGVRKAVWEALGGFDEQLPSTADDETEFFWRLQFAGYTLAHVPDAVMAYRLRPSLPDLLRQQYRYGYARRQLIRAYHQPLATEQRGQRARRRPALRRPSQALRDLAWALGHLVGVVMPNRTWKPKNPDSSR